MRKPRITRHQGSAVHARRRDDRPALEASGSSTASSPSRTREADEPGPRPQVRHDRPARRRTTCCSAPSPGARVARARRLASAVDRRRLDRRPHAGAARCARCTPSRGAVAEGAPDTTKFRTTEQRSPDGRHDRRVLRLDASRRRTRRASRASSSLVATGHATSLQHLPPRDTRFASPGHHLRDAASRSPCNFDSAPVQRVKVKDEQLARGALPRAGGTTPPKRAAALRRRSQRRRRRRLASGDARRLVRAAAHRRAAPSPPPPPATAGASSREAPMTASGIPPRLQALVDRLAQRRSLDRARACTRSSAPPTRRDGDLRRRRGAAIATITSPRCAPPARDAEREAGELSMDQVRQHLAHSVLPRLASEGVIVLPPGGLQSPDAPHPRSPNASGAEIGGVRSRGRRRAPSRPASTARTRPPRAPRRPRPPSARERARGARTRQDLSPAQGRERCGPALATGRDRRTAGPEWSGEDDHVLHDRRSHPAAVGPHPAGRRGHHEHADVPAGAAGIGYLSQEPSIFRKLSVEDNIVAILETLPLSQRASGTRGSRRLLDELSIKHLRDSKAYQLSGGERRRLEITRALVTEPKFMMLDEPFAGVDPIAVHDIQTIVAGLRHRGIGVLISDHNVEQTLDIVDRAYIMFDGQVKVSGTVRELVFDDTWPTSISARPSRRACARGSRPRRRENGVMRPGLGQTHPAQAGAEDQSTPLPGDGSALHAPARPPAAPQAGAAQQSLPRHGRAGGGGRGGRGRGRRKSANPETEAEKDEKGEIDWEEILLDGFDAGGRREEHEEREYYEPVTVDTRDLVRSPARPGQPARPRPAARCTSPTSSSATSTRTAISPAASRRSSRA